MTRAQRLALNQARARARITRIENRYGLLQPSVTVPASALPPPPVSSPITAVMDTAVTTTTPVTTAPMDIALPAPVLATDPLAIPMAGTTQPQITRQQIRFEAAKLRKLAGEIRKINMLNRLREQQEFTMGQQLEQSPDYSLVRGAARAPGSRAGTEGGSAMVNAFDPMQVSAPPGPGAPYPGAYGPPQNFFSPPQFQPSAGSPPGGYMLPPSQSGVPGGLIYTDVPPQNIDLSNEPIFEEQGEEFGASFADCEPLDSFAAFGADETAVKPSFFDSLTRLVETGGKQYMDIEKSKLEAKYPSRIPQSPASAGMRTGGGLNTQTLVSLGLVALGGFLLLKVATGR